MSQAYTSQLNDEATEWVVKLRSPAASKKTQYRFSRWLNQSDAHEAAFDAAVQDWQITGALTYSAESQAALRSAQRATANTERGAFNWFRWQAAAVASALLAVVFGALQLDLAQEPSASELYATSIGEQREISLNDGSSVKLNTNSRIRIEYRDDLRLLTLDKGEAFFKVASNRQRPFVVDTHKGTITAVGTAFSVNRQEDSIDVTVVEGIVSVKERQTQPEIKAEHKLVKADQKLQINQRGLSQVVATNAASALAWRNQLLVLEDKPLTDAIGQLNRYLTTPVDVSDPSLRTLRVSGTFSLQSPESTLDGLMTSFNLARDDSGATPRLYLPAE